MVLNSIFSGFSVCIGVITMMADETLTIPQILAETKSVGALTFFVIFTLLDISKRTNYSEDHKIILEIFYKKHVQ